jgi:hypothetical protein
MTEMEEFVTLLKLTAKSYLIFLLTASASATQQIQLHQQPTPEEPVVKRKVSTPYIQ